MILSVELFLVIGWNILNPVAKLATAGVLHTIFKEVRLNLSPKLQQFLRIINFNIISHYATIMSPSGPEGNH